MREMKESRISWVGKIPDSWKVDKNKHYFNLEKNIVGDKMNDYELLSLTKKGVIKKDENSIGGKVPESFETYQSVKEGQIVMCLFDLDVSAVFSGLSLHNGMISPAYKIYNCNKNMYNKYAKYWFECCFDGRKYKAYSKSLRYVVNTEDFGAIEIVVPPIEEQHKIADFLDEKVLEIDNIIEKTKETIDDYQKYKQSIIAEMTTKGLDKFSDSKDSNIDWIKEIPVSWQSMPLKSIFEFGKGLPITKADLVLKGNSVISYGQIHSKSNTGTSIDNNMIRYVSDEFLEEKYNSYKTQLNDFIFADTSEDLSGAGNCIYIDRENIFAGYHTIKLHPIINKNYKYLAYLFLTDLWRSQLRSRVSGIKLFSITQKILKETTIILPTDKEMSKIVKILDIKCEEINKIINSKQKMIEELEQYKKSLIYEYVTGKKEVI